MGKGIQSLIEVRDKGEVGFLGFVIPGSDPPPVLELADQALDQIAPAVFSAIVRDGDVPIALGGNDGFDTSCGQLRLDGVSIVALVGKQCFDAGTEHPEQWPEAFGIVRLPRRQDEAERSTMFVATSVEPGAEAAARPAKPQGLLIPFFSPTEQ